MGGEEGASLEVRTHLSHCNLYHLHHSVYINREKNSLHTLSTVYIYIYIYSASALMQSQLKHNNHYNCTPARVGNLNLNYLFRHR